MGIIYLICDPSNDLFKIGMTKSETSKRLKQLQTGNGSELFISKLHKTNYPYRVETMLHHHFFSKKRLNEWYALDIDDVVNFEKTCNTIEEQIECLKDNPFFQKYLK